tara:strand:+ start:15 stop:680 length:666 start_codon:yes stop_codon:yes gene_type:complete
MIQTSFFPQPGKEEPIKIIQIDSSGLPPRKVEELLPNHDILSDTYMIYPTGGYHPFYGVPNALPRYQLPIWPFVKRIKFSKYYSSEEVRNNVRRSNLNPNQTISQLNPNFHRGYFHVNLSRITTYAAIQHTTLLKNGKPCTYERQKVRATPMHKLVANAWIPNPDPGKFDIVMHINNDPTNYLPENLKWGNARMNAKGTRRHTDSMEQKYLDLVNKGIIKG